MTSRFRASHAASPPPSSSPRRSCSCGRLQLGNTTCVQPRIDRFRDVRVFNDLAVITRATDHFAVKLTFTSAHDSAPLQGVIPQGTTLKGALQLNF